MVSIANAQQASQWNAPRGCRRAWLRWISALSIWAFMLPLGQALACANSLGGRPLLGQRTQPDAAVAQLILIQQLDVDVTVLVKRASGEALHDSPGGRNAMEWVYVAPRSGSVLLCVYSSIRQRYSNSYDVRVADVSAASRQQREALQAMDAAGVQWARATVADRKAAAQQYALAASKAATTFNVTDYAKLYAALAAMASFDRRPTRQDLESLAAASTSEYIRYRARWARTDTMSLNQTATAQNDISMLQEASSIVGKLGFERDHAAITNRLGELYIRRGDMAAAETHLRRALSLARNDEQLLGAIRNNLGFLYLERSKLAEQSKLREKIATELGRSLKEHFAARRHSVKVDDRETLWRVENNIGFVAERLGDLRNAILHYRAALEMVDGTQDPLQIRVTHAALGRVHLNLGGYKAAEQYIAHALFLAQQSEPDEFMNRLHCSLGTTQQLQGRLAEAIRHHLACHAGAVRAHNVRQQAQALAQLAEDYQSAARPEDAWRTISEARSLLDQLNVNELQAKILAYYALLAHGRGQLELAEREVRRAIEVARDLPPTLRIQPFATAMTVFATRDEKAATAYGLQAIEAIEAVHASLDKESLAPAWSAQNEAFYDTLVGLLLHRYQRLGDSELLVQAFEIVERSAAVSLRQQLSIPRVAAQRVAQSSIVQSLSELANEQASSDAPSASLAYRLQFDLLTLARLSGSNVPVPAPLKLKDLQAALQPEQVALSYFFAKQRLWLFYLTRRELRLFDLGSKRTVEQLSDQVRRNVAAPAVMQRALQPLADLMLPRDISAGNAEWIIARHGSLQSIPFSALPVKVGGSPEPVLVHHIIKMVPSLSAYFMSKQGRVEDLPLDLAVFADPAFSRRKPDGNLQGQPPTGWTQSLKRLPATAREAENLQRYFAPARASIFVDSRATRSSLRGDAVRRAGILHIATHGYFRSSDPDIVGFALAESVDAGKVDSGFITLTELFTQRFDNELVVINGCDSAMGAQRGGEGMNSLTRGFISQGVSHVLSTLWDVPDRAAADFMAIFYERLSVHQAVARALHEAQQALRKLGPYRDAYFWAPYQLTTVLPDDRLQLSSFGPGKVNARR